MVMVATKHTDGLIDRLPLVSGRYEPFADLGSRSWFRTGGAAEAGGAAAAAGAERDSLLS